MTFYYGLNTANYKGFSKAIKVNTARNGIRIPFLAVMTVIAGNSLFSLPMFNALENYNFLKLNRNKMS